jgi:hypothetical protein
MSPIDPAKGHYVASELGVQNHERTLEALSDRVPRIEDRRSQYESAFQTLV